MVRGIDDARIASPLGLGLGLGICMVGPLEHCVLKGTYITLNGVWFQFSQ